MKLTSFLLIFITGICLAPARIAFDNNKRCTSRCDCRETECCKKDLLLMSKRDVSGILPIRGICQPYTQEGYPCGISSCCSPGLECMFQEVAIQQRNKRRAMRRPPRPPREGYTWVQQCVNPDKAPPSPPHVPPTRPCTYNWQCGQEQCCYHPERQIMSKRAIPEVFKERGICMPTKQEGETCGIFSKGCNCASGLICRHEQLQLAMSKRMAYGPPGRYVCRRGPVEINPPG